MKEVVNNLIVAANDSGFVKTDVKIDIKVTEVVDETVVATEILEDIKTAATQKLKELEIKAEVITAVELQAEETVQSEKDLTSSEEQTVSKENTGNNTSSKEDTTTSKPQDEKPVCSHTNTDVKSISTGSNVIDSSKLDAVNHTKVCKDCGVQVSLEKHSVSNGKCTVCGQSNFAVTDLKIGNAGISGGSSGHCGVELNGDGTPDYDLMVQDGYDAISFDSAQQYLDEETWVYKIPEAVFLEALKTKYVVDDALFARIKAQGKYNFYWHEHSYSNGIFFMAYVAAGDEPDFTHETLGYKDNGNGTFTVYYDYLEGGPSLDKSELVHKYYYAVEYSYSGASNLSVVKKIENDYEYYCINGWTPVVNTLRIKSIKKVTDINGITTVK